MTAAPYDPAPSLDDSRALAPIAVAAQLVKIPEVELRSRAEAAGALISHPRGAMVTLGDARKLARAPIDSELSHRDSPDVPAPKKKPKAFTPPKLAGADDVIIPTGELCALLGITRSDLTAEQLHYFAGRPPARLTRRGIGGGEHVYVKADIDAWLAANPNAPGVLRDRAKRRK